MNRLGYLPKIKILVFCGLMLSSTSCLKTDANTSQASASNSFPECSQNVAISSSCKVTTVGSIITTTSGSNITSYTNASASTSITASIPNGFYSSRTVTFTDADLIATNIAYGVNLFGVTGTYQGLASNAHRNMGTSQLSSIAEATTYAGTTLPAGYRDVPRITSDDEGTNAANVTYVNRSSPIDWTGRTCGTSGTIDQRIADCVVQLGSAATWSGTTNGNAGQAIWKIVSRTGNCTSTAPNVACREVWRDERTMLLWSSRVSDKINWCKASGSNYITGNPSAEDDPSNYCDDINNQTTGAGPAQKAVSACFSDSENYYTNTDATITNSNGKAGLNLSSTPAVSWRLPSLYDYHIANANGMRYVLPDMGNSISGATNTYEWTSTVLSTARASAWIYDSYLGYTSVNARNSDTYSATDIGARCVGR